MIQYSDESEQNLRSKVMKKLTQLCLVFGGGGSFNASRGLGVFGGLPTLRSFITSNLYLSSKYLGLMALW